MMLRRVAAIFGAAGAGFAVTSFAIVLAYNSYSEHRRNEWNSKTITARFTKFTVWTDENNSPSLALTYTLENHADVDYSLPQKDDSTKLFARTKSGDLTDTVLNEAVMVPVFVPAHSRVQVGIISTFKYGDIFDFAAAEKQSDSQPIFAKMVNAMRPELAGFVLFDKLHRYRIEFPLLIVSQSPPQR
jgi:hypothetical protein